MAKKPKNDNAQFVRKETFWLGTLLALAVGFFGGVMFAVLKSDSSTVPGSPQAQVPQAQVATPARPDMIASLEDETAKNPQNTNAWIQLGNEYFDSSQHEKAIWAYRKALELDPNNANVWTDLGVMYRRSNKPQEALQAFDKAIEVDPKHEPSRLNKGIVLLHDMQDFDGAIAAWEALLAVNPIAMAPTGRSVDEMIQQMKKQGGQMGQGPAN
jgi:cytochrome c-type biogenesis protein CcmH/NrfG